MLIAIKCNLFDFKSFDRVLLDQFLYQQKLHLRIYSIYFYLFINTIITISHWVEHLSLFISKLIKHKNAKEIRILSLKSLALDLEFKYYDSEALLKSNEEGSDDVCLELSKDDEACRFANRGKNQNLNNSDYLLKESNKSL